MSQENYYILLDLDPSVQDVSIIEAQIKKKHLEWTKLYNHPMDGNKARQQVALLPTIRKVMTADPAKRLELAQEARKIILQKQKEQYEQLDEAINMMSLRGYVQEGDILKLLKKKEFKGLTEKEVRARIKVSIRKGETPKKKVIEPIDTTIQKRIEGNLGIINKKDLYDFLEISPSSSLKTIFDKIKIIYQHNEKKANKTAEVTAIGKLLGECRTWFKNDEVRKRYDKTLDLKKFKRLEKLLDIAGMDEVIEQVEYDKILLCGSEFGLPKQETIEYIKSYAKKKRWALRMAMNSAAEQMATCGICNLLNPPKTKKCSNCGFPLKVECPNCKTVNPSTSKACSNCSFSIGDMPNAIPLIRLGETMLVEGKLMEAQQYFNKANLYWKDHPRISAGRKEIEKQLEKRKRDREKIQDLIHKRCFYAAQKALSAIHGKDRQSSEILRFRKIIESKIKEAEDLLRKTQRLPDVAQKEAGFTQVLQLCKDCQEAKDGLQQTPPDAPQHLSVKIQGARVDLTWKAVTSVLPIQYLVLRKKDNLPVQAKDGTVLTTTNETMFHDQTAIAGETYYYAIYTKREDTLSQQAVRSKGIVVVREVTDLQAVPSEGKISLKWIPPQKATRIEVWTKKEKAPAKRGEGYQLKNSRLDGATHQNLINNVSYHFLIIPVFKGRDGHEIFGSGTRIQCKPFAPPQLIENLMLQKNKHEIEIKWTPIRDQVELFYSNQKYPFSFKQNLSYDQLKITGQSIAIHEKGKAHLKINTYGLIYILPLSIKNNLAVVGKINSIVHLGEVKNLKGKYDDGKVFLTWDFPEGIEDVKIEYYDLANRSDFYKRNITNKKEEINKGLVIENIDSKWLEMEVLVQTKIEVDGKVYYSEGVKKTIKLKKTKVHFEVKKKPALRMPWGKRVWHFNLSVQLDGFLNIPLMLLVKENNKLISSKDLDRTKILEFNNQQIESSTFQANFTYEPSNRNAKALFFTLLPVNMLDKNEVEIISNGKKISL